MIQGNLNNQTKYRMQQFLSIILILGFLLLNPLSLKSASATDVPVPIAPADMATITIDEAPPLAIPEFKWSAVSGATSYRFQVSADIAFTSTVVNITTPNTSYTPTNATVFSDGTWFWRVRVEAPTPIGDYSGAWSFTKTWATAENQPTLLNPGSGDEIAFYDSPTFSWTPVTGAAEYKFQVYATPGGWATTVHSAITLATTYQPKDKLANGTYYWRVIPVDAGGHDGTPSDERPFVAAYNLKTELIPTLLSPLNASTPTFTPTFSWTAVRGAEYYQLQYSTDPSFSANVTSVTTRNTSHTPTTTLPNDVNYYWRVRVYSGASISQWTDSWRFIKQWYIKPVLLTPTNNYQHVRFPIFSWTPVPGAAYYKFEVSIEPGFNTSNSLYQTANTANTFMTPPKWDGATNTYYWRVTPYDGSGKAGVLSNTVSFVSYSASVAPHLVYPLYYYPPDAYPGFEETTTNPHEDRTVAMPVFMWHRVLIPAGQANQGDVYAEAYRVQVYTDTTFSDTVWTVDTENTAAAPTSANPFTPLPDTDYFWRIRPLIGGSEVGEWSQVWKTQFNSALGLKPPEPLTEEPKLIRPTDGFEYAEATPLLEWFPVQSAPSYEVEISSDSAFTSIVDSATVAYPAYAPTVSLAQRNLGSIDFGIYYWRVRVTGNSDWSDTRRFQVAAQSQWQLNRTPGAAGNRLQVGSDPALDTVEVDDDLTNLYVAQSGNYWYFGFNVPTAPTKDVTYGLYLDLDHTLDSGATSDARGYTISTISTFRPEYALYVLQESGVFSVSKVFLYRWTGTGWDTVQILGSIGGSVFYDSGYLEIVVPNTAIGYQDTTGSYAISLLSLPAGITGSPLDSVPSDPNVPGSGPISRFSNVTERMNQVMPPNDAGVDPTTIPSILSFFWDWSILTPWAGANMKAYLDPLFTTEAATYSLTSTTPNYARTYHAWEKDFLGDNTYYWRIQPRYKVGSTYYNGVWSQGWRFEREGFKPTNLLTSVTFATPTFSWDIVEGAETYDLQVDNDPAFGSNEISINTRQTSYTHTTTLANGTYYWRVRVKRNGSVTNNWSDVKSFTLELPIPQGLQHYPGDTVSRAPTLCWEPLIKSNESIPVLAAWKYRVQVSKDPSFTTIFDTIDTQQSCWTPIKGYDDGNYYWRVAMIDGNSTARYGNYSPFATLTKQYPTTSLVSPISGSTINATPTFTWTPVNGAAKYRLQVSIAANFSSTYDSVDTNNTTFTPTKKYANNTYYWRVAIIDADGKVGPYNNATLILDPYPAAFGKLSPANGATNQPSDLSLTWESSSGATSYEYCIDTSNDNACAGTWVSTGLTTEVSLTGLSAATYYWQVRAKNSYGNTLADAGTWWSFTVPAGPAAFSKTSPLSAAMSPLEGTILRWGTTTPVDRYEYCVDTTNNGLCDTEWISTDTNTQIGIDIPAEGKYFWQVRAIKGITTTYANGGTWWQFRAMQISPAINEKLNASKVTFEWGAVPNAVAYKLQLSTSPNFSVLLLNIKVLTTSYFFDTFLTNDTTYYWRIRPVYVDTKGPWSTAWTFESMDPLAAPALVSPDHKAEVTSPVMLDWDGVDRAAQYKVLIGKDLAFTIKVASKKTVETSADFTLPVGKYYWRVRALDPFGAKGPWSDVRIVKIIITSALE
jgi:hypothetical protein